MIVVGTNHDLIRFDQLDAFGMALTVWDVPIVRWAPYWGRA
jgi:hypothetical protein